MKRFVLALSLAVVFGIMVFGFSGLAKATLIDNLDGTITQIRNHPTYGDNSVLMWLKDASWADTSTYAVDGYMDWYMANDWIDSLNSANHLGYSNWRLPDTLPVNGISYIVVGTSYDGSTDVGYNIMSPNSEMAYMYYVELGNLGYHDTSGSYPQPGHGLNNTGLFDNLQTNGYWSGTDLVSDPDYAFYFDFCDGYQGDEEKGGDTKFAWAVRSDPIPEPGTMLLMVFGLLGIIGMSRFGKRHE